RAELPHVLAAILRRRRGVEERPASTDARQCWPGAPPRRGDGEGSRREREAVQRDGEVVRQRDGDGGDVRGHPDLRWLWIREGLPCRTALSGRKGYGDLRGYVRDSANCHCQRVV